MPPRPAHDLPIPPISTPMPAPAHTPAAPRRAVARLTAAALALAVLAACGGGDATAADSTAAAAATGPAATVLAPDDVSTAQEADVTTGIMLTGSLEPAERVSVTAQVGGTLGQIAVDRGSRVSRGQRLVTIQAEGVRSQVAGAQAAVAAAEANLAVARRQRDAAERLFQAGATSQLDAENARAAHEAAEAQVAAARAQATAVGEQAGFTVVTAPITGVVSERPAESGEAVSPGDPIVTIVNTATLELAGRIPVDAAASVRVGQPVTFTLDAYPNREFRGTVARKDPTADAATRQVGVYVRLPNANGAVTAGQFARGRVAGERVEDAVTVPMTAVQGSGSGAAVFVIESGRLERRPVTAGARDEQAGVVAILEGLRVGERVLTRPTATVAAGQPVVVASEQPAPAATAPAPADTSGGQ